MHDLSIAERIGIGIFTVMVMTAAYAGLGILEAHHIGLFAIGGFGWQAFDFFLWKYRHRAR